jgi:hypothetical protein
MRFPVRVLAPAVLFGSIVAVAAVPPAGAADGTITVTPAVTRPGPVTVAPVAPCAPPPAAMGAQASVGVAGGGSPAPPAVVVPVAASGTWSATVNLPSTGHRTVSAFCLSSPQAEGAYFAYAPADVAVVTSSVGYFVAGSFVANADTFGDASGVTLPAVLPQSIAPVVGVAAYEPTGLGYWTVAANGGVFSFGDAPFKGSAGGLRLAAPVVGMAATRSGQGYWLLGRDGGIFTFGDAPFFGSGVGEDPGSPAVGIARTGFHTSPGYLIAHADGAVFSHVAGSVTRAAAPIGGLAAPVVGIAATPSEMGWYLAARDGGVFTFGDAHFSGSLGSVRLAAPIVGITARFDGGYWLVGADEGIFTFGGAPFLGTLAGTAHAGFGRTVGIAATPDPLAPLA